MAVLNILIPNDALSLKITKGTGNLYRSHDLNVKCVVVICRLVYGNKQASHSKQRKTWSLEYQNMLRA